jgi:hypothetical protein
VLTPCTRSCGIPSQMSLGIAIAWRSNQAINGDMPGAPYPKGLSVHRQSPGPPEA